MISNQRAILDPRFRAINQSEIAGWAVVYWSFSHEMNFRSISDKPFREIIMPNAFEDSVNAGHVGLDVNHDMKYIANQDQGNLVIEQRHEGLWARLINPPTDLWKKAREGKILGGSYAADRIFDGWHNQERLVARGELLNLTLITEGSGQLPAFPETQGTFQTVGEDHQLEELYQRRELEFLAL